MIDFEFKWKKKLKSFGLVNECGNIFFSKSLQTVLRLEREKEREKRERERERERQRERERERDV